jgi:SAM-dependent methyltransferase
VRRLWRRITGGTPGKRSFWRYSWIATAQVIAAAERVRPHVRGLMLDVGCGSMRARGWYRDHLRGYVGIDLVQTPYPDTRVDVFARGEAMPFRAASFDTVFGMSMLTCLTEPLQLLLEARRVLRDDGVLVMEFTQMAPLHDEPHDYFRFTRLGARWLCERAGFEIVECVPIGGLWTRVALSTLMGLERWNRGPTRVLTEIPVRAAYILVQLSCYVLDRLFPNPREVLAHLVVARIATPIGPSRSAPSRARES